MVFRAALAALTLLAWATAGWFARHESSAPAVLGRYSAGYLALLLGLLAIAVLLTAAHFAPVYPRLYRQRAGIAAAAVSALGSLLVAELVVRLADPAGISYYEESRRYHLDKVADHELVFRHPPGMDAVYQGVRVRTNDLGFRDRPVGPRVPGELRILVLGDSLTFGWGVAEEDTYPRQLEALLAGMLGRPVRTINTGVGGYNSVQELGVARRHVGRLRPDLLLLLYVANDVDPVQGDFDPAAQLSLAGRSPPEVIQRLVWNSWAWRLARHAWTYRGAGPERALVPGTPGWRASVAAIAGLGDLAQAAGVPLVVVFNRYATGPGTDRLYGELGAAAERHGFRLVDSAPWFAGRPLSGLLNSVVDSHPNALGQRLLAEGMAGVLVTLPLSGRTGPASPPARDP
jgi:lysophospholipase L1-like esterase